MCPRLALAVWPAKFAFLRLRAKKRSASPFKDRCVVDAHNRLVGFRWQRRIWKCRTPAVSTYFLRNLIVVGAEIVTEKGGWLTKRGHRVKNWKRRWFVLNDDQLRFVQCALVRLIGQNNSYFKSPTQGEPQGVIQMSTVWAAVRGVPPTHACTQPRRSLRSALCQHRTVRSICLK